LKLDNPSVK
jgi:hypothetical protein